MNPPRNNLKRIGEARGVRSHGTWTTAMLGSFILTAREVGTNLRKIK
jgi:hypothetical protein